MCVEAGARLLNAVLGEEEVDLAELGVNGYGDGGAGGGAADGGDGVEEGWCAGTGFVAECGRGGGGDVVRGESDEGVDVWEWWEGTGGARGHFVDVEEEVRE